MPNEQNNPGLFLALNCEILSSVQTVAFTYPDTWDHTTNVASPHLTLVARQSCLHLGTKSIAQSDTAPTAPSAKDLGSLTEQCRDDRLTFSYVLRAPQQGFLQSWQHRVLEFSVGHVAKQRRTAVLQRGQGTQHRAVLPVGQHHKQL